MQMTDPLPVPPARAPSIRVARPFRLALALPLLAACAFERDEIAPAPAPVDATATVTRSTPASDHPFAWLEGHWIGEGFGGTVEESWLPARGGSMLGVFRLVVDDAPRFYELITIDPVDGATGHVMLLKHFSTNLRSWEGQDGKLELPAEVLGPRHVRFGPAEYDGTDPDVLRVYVQTSDEPGAEPVALEFRRTE